jgi:hypothetical protein
MRPPFNRRQINCSVDFLCKQNLFVAFFVRFGVLRPVKLIKDKGDKGKIFRGYVYLAPGSLRVFCFDQPSR